ncbi:terpene synthase family protein [Shivajiella indica]|uniref:Terpene synthase n=1 Tax=Shivajiella indica TaxID=872115 RepID=A0ABW5B9E5_9BACT
MKMTNEVLWKLKNIMDKLVKYPIDDYLKLEKFITLNRYQKNEVIRKENTKVDAAHLILEGSLALYQDDKIIRPYFKEQVAFDLNSYYEKTTSPYRLVALENSEVVTVTRTQELKILTEIPSLSDLSNSLKEIAAASDQKWLHISQLHYKESIPLVYEYFGNKLSILTRKQLSELIGVHYRTIDRYNNKRFQNKNSIATMARNREIFNYHFPSILHPEHEYLENITCHWVNKLQLLPRNKDVIQFQKMKMSHLASRLYPEADIEISVWISKLFALLFILDDYTDQLPKGKKSRFWLGILGVALQITENKTPHPDGEMPLKFIKAISYLWTNLSFLSSPIAIKLFRLSLVSYVRECAWEASNLDENKIPSIETYLIKRPIFSGGNLALNLIPFTLERAYPNIHQVWPSIHRYMTLASKLIFISNDLISFDKENKLNDPHNWIFLLSHDVGMEIDQARKHLLSIHDQVLEEFLTLDRQYLEKYSPENRTLLQAIKCIKYQVSGSVSWSVKDTKRYVAF